MWGKTVNLSGKLSNNQQLSLDNVLVSYEHNGSDGILIGRTDLNKLNAKIDFESGKLTFGPNQTIPMSYDHQSAVLTVSAGRKSINAINEDCSSIAPEVGDSCYQYDDNCNGCKDCTNPANNTNDAIYDCPVSDYTLKAHIERIRQRDRETYTHLDVTIDPEGEARYPKLAQKLRRLNNEYKEVFSAATGDTGPDFAVDVEMKGRLARPAGANRHSWGRNFKQYKRN